MAPTNISRQIAVIVPTMPSGSTGNDASAAAKHLAKSTDSKVQKINMVARMNPKSPTRLTMKAFFPASAADFLLNQNPISRYEHRPTPSQPTNISR